MFSFYITELLPPPTPQPLLGKSSVYKGSKMRFAVFGQFPCGCKISLSPCQAEELLTRTTKTKWPEVQGFRDLHIQNPPFERIVSFTKPSPGQQFLSAKMTHCFFFWVFLMIQSHCEQRAISSSRGRKAMWNFLGFSDNQGVAHFLQKRRFFPHPLYLHRSQFIIIFSPNDYFQQRQEYFSLKVAVTSANDGWHGKAKEMTQRARTVKQLFKGSALF